MNEFQIYYIGGLDKINPENDNIDVHVTLSDGRIYSFVVATPSNLYWYMDNDGVDCYTGLPILFVRTLTEECVEAALRVLINSDDGRWLEVYGVLQEVDAD